MALKAILKNLDDVPDVLKEEYTEKDGKFYLDVTPVDGYALEDISGLKKALESERSSKKETETKLDSIKTKIGENDLDELLELAPKIEEFKNFDPDKQVAEKIKVREREMLKKHEKEVKGLQSSNAKIMKELENVMIVSRAKSAINKANGREALLLPHVLSRLKLTTIQDNGDTKYVAQVIDPITSNERIKDSSGATMGLDDLIEEMKSSEDFGILFDVPASGGSGAGKSNNDNSTSNRSGKKTVITPDENGVIVMDDLEGISKGDVTVNIPE